MASVNLKSLIGKLNDHCRQTLEAAAGLCLSRTHYNVELEHWLTKLVEAPDSDISAIFRYFGVDTARILADLTRCLDKMKTGNARPPALSPYTVELAQHGWMIASIDYGATRTRSGHLLLALLSDESLARQAQEMSRELEKISPEVLKKDLQVLIADTSEAGTDTAAPTGAGVGRGAPGTAPPSGPTRTPALDQYTIDLTERARQGQIDPVIGRDAEIRQVIDILTRRRQNNPILTGEAGVGKTAVVEGFALRIAAGDVPPALRNVALRTLDLGLLQAGAGVKGEFENRLRAVIDEVQRSPHPIILFIDEAHTLIGAGGQAGQGDAANLLKPALARGQLRTIAATTWAEYKKYFERDAALARRFQVVKVEEPDDEKAIAMMRGLTDSLTSHFAIEILDDAVSEAVKMSKRYIAGRQLPDKSVSVLDTACARVATSLNATPAEIEDCQRSIDHHSMAIAALQREAAAGHQHSERLEKLLKEKAEFEEQYQQLVERWEKEKVLVAQIRDFRARLMETQNNGPGEKGEQPAELSPEDREKLLAHLAEVTGQLKALQGENPLIQPYVDAQTIAQIVASWTGIPVGRIVSDEIRSILTLKEQMEERIVGQSHALDTIAQRIRISRANLADPRRPIGVFFLVGPSGVGKTETAVTLAELVYGGTQNMTVINMSEFKEEHKVSMLLGSPPGYVGYGEGGVLTEAVRRRPYSVVLLDEMEKAHPGVQDIFYQVFDKGMLRDGEGRDIDFKNTLILMTSNAAQDTISKLCSDPDTTPSVDALREAMHPELLKTFKPAFLGRVTVVPYFPLNDEMMRLIVELQLKRVGDRVRQNYQAEFTYDPEVVDHIVSRCTEVESGARNVDRILGGTMLPELAGEFLSRMSEGQPIKKVNVAMTPEGTFDYQIGG